MTDVAGVQSPRPLQPDEFHREEPPPESFRRRCRVCDSSYPGCAPRPPGSSCRRHSLEGHQTRLTLVDRLHQIEGVLPCGRRAPLDVAVAEERRRLDQPLPWWEPRTHLAPNATRDAAPLSRCDIPCRRRMDIWCPQADTSCRPTSRVGRHEMSPGRDTRCQSLDIQTPLRQVTRQEGLRNRDASDRTPHGEVVAVLGHQGGNPYFHRRRDDGGVVGGCQSVL